MTLVSGLETVVADLRLRIRLIVQILYTMRAGNASVSGQILYARCLQVVMRFIARVRLSKLVIHGDKRAVLSAPELLVCKEASL